MGRSGRHAERVWLGDMRDEAKGHATFVKRENSQIRMVLQNAWSVLLAATRSSEARQVVMLVRLAATTLALANDFAESVRVALRVNE